MVRESVMILVSGLFRHDRLRSNAYPSEHPMRDQAVSVGTLQITDLELFIGYKSSSSDCDTNASGCLERMQREVSEATFPASTSVFAVQRHVFLATLPIELLLPDNVLLCRLTSPLLVLLTAFPLSV